MDGSLLFFQPRRKGSKYTPYWLLEMTFLNVYQIKRSGNYTKPTKLQQVKQMALE